MLPHVTHVGVHDHGFNNLSTYGNLRRLMLEGKIKHDEWEAELASHDELFASLKARLPKELQLRREALRLGLAA